MRIIKAPNPIPPIPDLRGHFSVFLGGSIEMGRAEDWQAILMKRLKDVDGIILNPRRDDWDASWVQHSSNPQFREQVEWELRAQEVADCRVYYFAPGTQSPISLLELGLFGRTTTYVCCPEGFWRKGNVDIVCMRYGIPQVASLDDLAKLLAAEAESSVPAEGAAAKLWGE